MPALLVLFLIPLIPALTAIILVFNENRGGTKLSGGLAALAIFSSFLLTITHLAPYVLTGTPMMVDAGAWIDLEDFTIPFLLRMDALSFWMTLLITGFGSLIAFYSIQYMEEDDQIGRYFSSIVLFVASMLLLVLADNLFILFIGWEGVGLSSYLLIGHYHREKGVPKAAFRAFFVNRIGDIFFLLGLFLIYRNLQTVSFDQMSQLIQNQPISEELVSASLLMLGGAFAKSAQAPLHIWLPDAMAGPTPISALIHAATMVTAGVYLVMRFSVLYSSSNTGRVLLLVCALVTLFVGTTLASVLYDVKKILAYSTLAHLGMMFLALSASAYDVAMFHLFGHASFKALLFLAAGSIIYSAHHEQDIRKLNGVLRFMPVTRVAFWVGIIGASAMIPYLSSGYFSSVAVTHAIENTSYFVNGVVLSGKTVHTIMFVIELLSPFYLFRLLAYLESAPDPSQNIKERGWAIRFVLILLSIFGVAFGYLTAPQNGVSSFVDSLGLSSKSFLPNGFTWALAVTFVIAALTFTLFYFSRSRNFLGNIRGSIRILDGWWPVGRLYYFDDAYRYLILKPIRFVASLSNFYLEISLFQGVIRYTGDLFRILSYYMRRVQSGRVHHYSLFMIITALAMSLWMILN